MFIRKTEFMALMSTQLELVNKLETLEDAYRFKSRAASLARGRADRDAESARHWQHEVEELLEECDTLSLQFNNAKSLIKTLLNELYGKTPNLAAITALDDLTEHLTDNRQCGCTCELDTCVYNQTKRHIVAVRAAL